MPSNNVFQYNNIRTRKRSAKKSIKTGKKNLALFWNPESTVLESGNQYTESGIHSMESRIQDCPGFPYMGRVTWSIFWLFIKSWIVWFVRFWQGLNTMNLFFSFKFNESLLALNHNDNLFSSAFSILVRQSLSLWDTNTFVSSANNISCNIVDVLIISLM